VEPSEAADVDVVREQFETPRSAARGRILQAIHDVAAARITSREAPGTRFRNVHVSIHLSALHTRRYAFPAYAIAYRYRRRPYRTVISGQDSTCVIGQLPRSLAKMILLGAAMLAAVATLIVGLILRLV
jgi:hypothetical protein